MNGISLNEKILVVVIILLFLGMSVIPSAGTVVEKKSTLMTFYDGDTLYVGGSGSGNYSKIQDAIDNANDGDTVFVYDDSSPYYENVIINKSINLIGENRDTTVIDGGGEDDVVYVSAEGVNITGFTVENGGRVCTSVFDLDGTLVDMYCDSGIEIRSNTNNVFGNIIGIIFIKESSDNSIFHNKINRVELFKSSNNGIFNNTVSKSFIMYYSIENIIFENNINHRLSLKNSSNYNIIFHNNFVLNILDDKCDNIWDNGYPSCGNYWDDYIGEDNDGDGVGDTPYNISGGNNQDRYPLMEPYGMTELTISMEPGLFKFSGTIKNIGNKTAFNVQWKITIDGGIFFLIKKEVSGYLPRPLLAGEEMSVSSGIIFGLGRIVITVAVWADNAPLVSESIPGIIILFFIMI